MTSAHPPAARIGAIEVIAVGTYLLIAVLFALWISFPNEFDELAHVSAIREQMVRPSLFPDLRSYRLLDADDLRRWSGARNYLNHPSLYYLAMAAIGAVDDGVSAARSVNVALATAALALVVLAGRRRFPTTAGRAVFVVAAAAFPKGPVIAAGVNNDNLAACAAAAVFAGMVGMEGAVWWLAAGLALGGWTKLTALLALATIAGCRQLGRSVRGQVAWFGKENAIVAAGLAVGCVPYLANLLLIGQLLYVNEAHFRVAADARPVLGGWQFHGVFFTQLAMKWPAAEYSLPLVVAASWLLLFLAVAAAGARRVAGIGVPYLAGSMVTLIAHAAFGWNSFQTLGDLTIAQSRYYNVLWPGLAFCVATQIARWRSRFAVPWVVFLLVPSVIGGVVLLGIRGG